MSINISMDLDRFQRSRYVDDLWLSFGLRWTDEDLRLLAAAADLGIGSTGAANTLGRPPDTLVHKALSEGIRVPREWLTLIRKPAIKPIRLLNLNYPYIARPDDRHDDIIAINRLVAKDMPGREDVCQSIMLALLESKTSIAELRTDPKALKAFTRAFRKDCYERSGYGIESMDMTLYSTDGNGRSKYDDARYGYTPSFENDLIERISNEEVASGIPAVFWARSLHQ